ncbi:MAG: YceI family protein [Pseudomonadota bacterium]|nr:YceI family protein [Pseudomonadota bacterium]
MIRRLAAATLTLALAINAGRAAAEDTYAIDPVHSQPTFEVRHMGFSSQRGSFGKATGKVTLDRAAKKGSVDVTIDTTSIKTIDPRLDTHVKSEDFFNVAKYPTITFKSTNLTFDGDRVVGLDGELTLLGVTKPVTLKVTNDVCGEHPFNKKAMCGAEATTTINRSEWGMKYGIPKAVSDEVKITIPIEAYKEQ